MYPAFGVHFHTTVLGHQLLVLITQAVDYVIEKAKECMNNSRSNLYFFACPQRRYSPSSVKVAITIVLVLQFSTDQKIAVLGPEVGEL